MKRQVAPASVPAPLRALLKRLPERPPALALATALNAALAAGILPREAFDALRGKRLRIELTDAGVGLTLSYGARHFHAARGAPDVTVRASAADFVRLALRREDPDSLFFSRRLVIEGDTDLGLIVKNTLDAVDWDRLPAPLRALLRRAQHFGAH
jgi:predicted lipid carrier protein YhbT